MASSCSQAQASVGVGASSSIPGEPTIVGIKPTNRNPDPWAHFDLCEMSNNSERARCKGCGKLLKSAGNSSLRNHLTKSCMVVKNNPAKNQSQMTSEAGVWNFDPEMVRLPMGNLVIQEGLAFNHFDNPILTRMIQNTLQPRYHHVSRTTIRRDCLKRWKEARNELILGFENLKTGVNLTTDVWSAPHGLPESYLCVTAHWIDPDTWQMMKRTIAFEMFGYPHTGENLFLILDGIIQTFKLQQKIFSISFDNASNNTNAVQRLKLKYQPLCNGAFFHTRCVAHIINLVVQDGLAVTRISELKDSFKQVLRDVFQSSKKRYMDYKRLCKTVESPCYGPNWDVPTRWNSTWTMFASALKQRSTLSMFHEEMASRGRVVSFPEESWEAIESLTDLLEAFKNATTILSGVYYPTSSLVLYQLWVMSLKINEFQVDGDLYTQMLLPMKLKLIKYFQEMPAVFTCATALNPNFNASGVETSIDQICDALGLNKEDPHCSTNMKNAFNRNFQSMYEVYLRNYGATTPIQAAMESPATSNKSSFFKTLKRESHKRSKGATTSSELGRYIGTAWIETIREEEFDSFDILAWWKERASQFPVLSAMARDLLSVQASTVASESAFSISGRILSVRRTRLTPSSLEMCICLKDHLDAMERVQDKTNLECELEVEETIHGVEVEQGLAGALSDEEQIIFVFVLF